MPRFQIQEIAVDVGGGSPDVPNVEFEFDATGVVEGDPDFTIRILLRDPTTGLEVTNTSDGPVLVPFTLGGTATLDEDYWFLANLGDETKYELPFARIPVGRSDVFLNVRINPDVQAEGEETAIITLVESADGFDLDRANLGAELVHTLTIQDAATFSVFFQSSAGTIQETDQSQPYVFRVRTSQDVPAGGDLTFDIVDLGTGSAVAGVDFTGLPINGVTINPGLGFRDVLITVLGDTLQTGNRTVDMAIQNVAHPVVTPQIGSPDNHRLTIQEDDSVVDNTGTVEFQQTQRQTVAENGTLLLDVVYSAGPGHDAFSVDFDTTGVLPNPASPGTDFTIDPSPLLFNPGEAVRQIRIDGIPDFDVEPDRSFAVNLLAINNPPGGTITVGPNNSLQVTVLDQGGPPAGGEDGDLTDYLGIRVARERRTFDSSRPHLRIYPPGVGINTTDEELIEAVEIPPGFTNWQEGDTFSPSSQLSFSGLQFAVQIAEQLWWHLHGPNGIVDQWASTSAVPVGRELDEVRIEFVVGDWDPLRFYDQYTYQTTAGGGSLMRWLQSSAIRWGQLGDNWNIRDLILYTEKDNPAYSTPVCVTFPKTEIGTSALGGNDGVLDNVRWERINQGPSNSDYTSSCFAVQGASGSDAGSTKPHQGRLKLYDCQFGMAPRYDVSNAGGSGGVHDGPQRVIRSDPACWDIRHPDPSAGTTMPWPPFWPGNEHAFYVGPLVGPTTYPDLDYNWTPEGVSSSNVFLNLFPAERHAPTHFDATPTGPGGAFEGPPHSSPNTFMQWVQRPNYNSSADASSGNTFVARCEARGVAGTRGGGGIGWAIYGYSGAGAVYFKDIRVTPHFATGVASGGIQFLEDGSGNNSSGPQGRFRLEEPAASGRTYSSNMAIIDGFTLVGDNGGKTPFRFNGARYVKLIRYDLRAYIGGQPQMEWNGVNQACGNAFCEVWDTSDLQHPDTGVLHDAPFSTYPGWRPTGTKIKDEYHANWWRDQVNERNLTDSDVDNLPSLGPPSYTQTNGIARQQWLNRLTATGDGLGTVDQAAGSPAWTGGVYTGGNTTATPPNVEVEQTVLYIGEAQPGSGYYRLAATMEDPTHAELRVPFDIQLGGGISGITIERAEQVLWTQPDTLVTWIAAVSPVPLLPVGGRLGSLASSPQVGPDFAEDDVWGGTYELVMFRFRADVGGPLTTGTKTIEFRLRNPFVGGTQPQFENPIGSGTFVDTGHSGPQQAQLRVIPAVDFSEVEFGQGQVEFNLTGASDGDQVQVQALRLGGATPDSQNLETTVPLGQQQQGAGTFTPNVTVLDYDASDFLINVVVTITDVAQWADGDTATLTMDFASSENAQAGAVTAFTINFTT